MVDGEAVRLVILVAAPAIPPSIIVANPAIVVTDVMTPAEQHSTGDECNHDQLGIVLAQSQLADDLIPQVLKLVHLSTDSVSQITNTETSNTATIKTPIIVYPF